MESKEEVQSDDGSYELVDVDDYRERLITKANLSRNMDLSSEDSYDLLSSDLSDGLVLSEEEEEDSKDITVNEDDISAPIESLSLESNDDSGFKDSTKSDSLDEEHEEEEQDEDDDEEEDDEEQEKDEEQDEDDDDEEDDEDEEEEDEDFCGMDYPDSKLITNKLEVMTMTLTNPMLKQKLEIKDVAKTHILHYLPAKSLTRCQLVSKEWDRWIKTPFFKHTQSQHFSQTSGFFQDATGFVIFISLDKFSYGVPIPSLNFLPEKASIKSSCNGLLLCQDLVDESKYYVCNPANKQWNELPCSSYYHGKDPKIVLAFEPYPLFFEPQYQVICPFSLLDEESVLYFDIYDSKTKSWRVSEEIYLDFNESDLKTDGVFVNGVVYWETTGGEMLAFDLKNEIYSVQTVPKGGAFSKWNGELCYLKGRYRHSNKKCELDVYQGGGVMSLKRTMRFGVAYEGGKDGDVVECRILGNSCDDVVAVILKRSEFLNCLFAYHVKSGKVKGPWFISGSNNVFPYVNSLVSISS